MREIQGNHKTYQNLKEDIQSIESGGIGVYIHIPFCKSKCHYCDFNSYVGKDSLIPEYCNALIKEIGMYSGNDSFSKKVKARSIYIGGGTPSLISEEYISRIIERCKNCFEVSEDAELTIEANPGTITGGKVNAYKKVGINRLSLGLQSWQNRLLKYIGRCHSVEDFIDSLYIAREAGFDNINADLIFGLPSQTFREWEETLEKVIDKDLEHLSCYDLKIEEGTVLYNKVEEGQIQPIDDILDREMYHETITKLKGKGFNHYEISNFSKPGYESKHNLIYWKAENYIGLGAGAHSYFNNRRYSNIENPMDYTTKILTNENTLKNIQEVAEADRISEYLILGLRLVDGICMHEFKRKFGRDILELYGGNIDLLVNRELLSFSEGKIKLTRLGLDLANQVFVEFI